MTILLAGIKDYWIAITLCTFISITILSLYPQASLPAVPGTDKTHHLIAYAILMFPVALRKPRYWLLIGIFFILWGGSIELVQPYVNRYGDWFDLVANIGGIVCGLFAAEVFNRVVSAKRKGD